MVLEGYTDEALQERLEQDMVKLCKHCSGRALRCAGGEWPGRAGGSEGAHRRGSAQGAGAHHRHARHARVGEDLHVSMPQ